MKVKKEHIFNNDEIGEPTLCGRTSVQGLLGFGSSFVKFFKVKKKDWCITCKNLYNANIASNKKELLK